MLGECTKKQMGSETSDWNGGDGVQQGILEGVDSFMKEGLDLFNNIKCTDGKYVSF